jgi:hypothetical protein
MSKMSLDDVDEAYGVVLDAIINTVPQTQTLLADTQPARTVSLPAIRQTQVPAHSPI